MHNKLFRVNKCFVSASPSIQPEDKNATPGGLYCLSQKPIELQLVTNIYSQKTNNNN